MRRKKAKEKISNTDLMFEKLDESLETSYAPQARRLCDNEIEDMLLHIRDRALYRVVKGIDNFDPLEIVELTQKIMDKSCDQLAKQYENQEKRTGSKDTSIQLIFSAEQTAPAADRAIRECGLCTYEYRAHVAHEGVYGTLSDPFVCPQCLIELTKKAAKKAASKK